MIKSFALIVNKAIHIQLFYFKNKIISYSSKKQVLKTHLRF